MGLFNKSQLEQINKVAKKSTESIQSSPVSTKSINNELNEISKQVMQYFKDSESILITSVDQLHDYITNCIECGYVGIDTETTGLDRLNDYIVGVSLYYPGYYECYIPIKHKVPIFDVLYKEQLTYEEVGAELSRLVDSDVRLIFANADFDLSMIYKDIKVDLCDRFYYDVILAWRCLKENELHNGLKELYNKYVLKGKSDPKKFSDFFSPTLFPYCKPEIAKLYAANDAKITYELFKWQLPYCTKDNPKCKKAHLEQIADLIWEVEFPLVKVCQMLHRRGVFIDNDASNMLIYRYRDKYKSAQTKLQSMVQEILDKNEIRSTSKRPFSRGSDFNPSSPVHVKYLLYDIMKLPKGKNGGGTGKEILREFNLPVTNQILEVRSYSVLINTFVEKMPKSVWPADNRIHGQFKQIGASTGRFSSAEPNLQNIPSHATDIRHMFRATPSFIKDVECNSDENSDEISVNLFRWNKVYTSCGLKYVNDLNIGDSVKLKNNDTEVYVNVKQLEDNCTDSSICNVVFGL